MRLHSMAAQGADILVHPAGKYCIKTTGCWDVNSCMRAYGAPQSVIEVLGSNAGVTSLKKLSLHKSAFQTGGQRTLTVIGGRPDCHRGTLAHHCCLSLCTAATYIVNMSCAVLSTPFDAAASLQVFSTMARTQGLLVLSDCG